MEKNIFDILKMQLVEYFKQIEKYQIHEKRWQWRKGSQNNLFLINLFNKSYQIIKILDYRNQVTMWNSKDLKQNQLDIDKLRKNITTTNHSKLRVLTIVLTNVIHEPLFFSNHDSVVFVNSKTVIAQLKPIFSQIDQIETLAFTENQNLEDEVFDPKTVTSEDLKEGSQLQKRIKDFHNLTTKQNVFLTYFFAFMPLLLPILIPFFLPQIRDLLQAKNMNSMSYGWIESQLILGASFKHLVFQAGQFWRWISYPLAGDNMFNLFISCMVIFYCGRLVESFYKPWKLLIIMLATTVIVGFVHSVVGSAMYSFRDTVTPNILAGPIFWGWAIVPPLYIFAFTKSDFSAFVVRRRLILPTIFLVITLLFLTDVERMIMPLGLTFFISFFISYFIGYNKQTWDWRRFVALALVASCVIIVTILWVTNNRYFTDEGRWTFSVLTDYDKLGLVDLKAILATKSDLSLFINANI